MSTSGDERKYIRVDLNKSLGTLGIPYIEFQYKDKTLRFIVDTGASMNFIRKDTLEFFKEDVKLLDQKAEYFGIDNVEHECDVYTFKFKIDKFQYEEEFQSMEHYDALTFPLEDCQLVVDGLLGTPFLHKYGVCICYRTHQLLFEIPCEEISNAA